MKYFHIQLTLGSPYIIELGWSLAEVMAHISKDFSTTPYSYFTTPSDIGFKY